MLTLVFLIFMNLFSFYAKSLEYILEAENWLNRLTTMTADFVQISSDGRIAEGKLFLKKGKGFRFEYNPPSKLLIVGRKNIVIVQDLENKTSTNYPLFNKIIQVELYCIDLKTNVEYSDIFIPQYKELSISQLQISFDAIMDNLDSGSYQIGIKAVVKEVEDNKFNAHIRYQIIK